MVFFIAWTKVPVWLAKTIGIYVSYVPSISCVFSWKSIFKHIINSCLWRLYVCTRICQRYDRTVVLYQRKCEDKSIWIAYIGTIYQHHFYAYGCKTVKSKRQLMNWEYIYCCCLSLQWISLERNQIEFEMDEMENGSSTIFPQYFRKHIFSFAGCKNVFDWKFHAFFYIFSGHNHFEEVFTPTIAIQFSGSIVAICAAMLLFQINIVFNFWRNISLSKFGNDSNNLLLPQKF